MRLTRAIKTKQTMTSSEQPNDFESVKKRLEEIADAVDDESLPLDDALDLFEEAVSLGLKVSDFVEEGIVVEDEDMQAEPPGGESVDEQAQADSKKETLSGGVSNVASGQRQGAGASE